VFVRQATEALNLVALSYGRKFVKSSDVIVATEMEHHSNLVPWQMLADRRGARLRFIPLNDDGTFTLVSIPEDRDLPGLVRYEEVVAGVIPHALRFTAQRTRRDEAQDRLNAARATALDRYEQSDTMRAARNAVDDAAAELDFHRGHVTQSHATVSRHRSPPSRRMPAP